jgi:hypothetical protein
VSEGNTRRIEDALHKITGQSVTVRFELVTAPLAVPAPVASNPPATPAADRKKQLQSLPLFRKANESLGAQIWHVDDEFNPGAPSRPATNPETDTDEI